MERGQNIWAWVDVHGTDWFWVCGQECVKVDLKDESGSESFEVCELIWLDKNGLEREKVSGSE